MFEGVSGVGKFGWGFVGGVFSGGFSRGRVIACARARGRGWGYGSIGGWGRGEAVLCGSYPVVRSGRLRTSYPVVRSGRLHPPVRSGPLMRGM